jgi:hypothetical protein
MRHGPAFAIANVEDVLIRLGQTTVRVYGSRTSSRESSAPGKHRRAGSLEWQRSKEAQRATRGVTRRTSMSRMPFAPIVSDGLPGRWASRRSWAAHTLKVEIAQCERCDYAEFTGNWSIVQPDNQGVARTSRSENRGLKANGNRFIVLLTPGEAELSVHEVPLRPLR